MRFLGKIEKQMDQNPGYFWPGGMKFTIGRSLTVLLKPRPVSITIKHLDDHPFTGCAPSKFNNNVLLVLYLMDCASVLCVVHLFRPDEGF